MAEQVNNWIRRGARWLQGYLGVASTTAVTFLVAWFAEKGIEVDAVWLQTVAIGAIGIVVLSAEKGLMILAARVEALGWVQTLVKWIRLGQQLPSYEEVPPAPDTTIRFPKTGSG